jgi:hypothetical protein
MKLATGWRQAALLLGAVVLLSATVWLCQNRGGAGFRADRRSWNAVLQCVDCGHRFNGELKLTYPLAAQICPNCGKPAAWQIKRCSRCDYIFVPELTGDPPRPPRIPKCPKCSDDRYVGAVLPGSVAGGTGR